MTGDDLLLPFLEEDADCPPTVPRPVPSIPPRKARGFAAMDPVVRRAISAKGGRAAHEAGTAYRFTSDSGREAGRKGGQARRRRSVAA
jgi:general stress protein YciG